MNEKWILRKNESRKNYIKNPSLKREGFVAKVPKINE